MKPVFMCEYCDFIGTAEQVEKHEVTCSENYDRRSCLTCKHRGFLKFNHYKCACGNEIPENKIYEFCRDYDREERTEAMKFDNILGGLFGGFKC